MSADDVLIGKADQLMRRQRSFVASPKNPASESGDEADDLPLLTEVVASPTVAAANDGSALRLRLEQSLTDVRTAMMGEFERWLDEQLPQAVSSAMDGITDRLVALIIRRARSELLPRLVAIASEAQKPAAGGAGEAGGQPV